MSHWLDKVIELLQANTADLRELARMAGGNPKIFYLGVRLSDLDVSGQNLDGMQFGDDAASQATEDVWLKLDRNEIAEFSSSIRFIKQTGKQEERLAILLKTVLSNRKFAREIVGQYGRDKAKFANLVVQDLRRILKSESKRQIKEGSFRITDVGLAHILFGRFRRGMQLNRILLLYYMAKHLHQFPDINKYLRGRFERSFSVYLDPYRDEIKRLLRSKR